MGKAPQFTAIDREEFQCFKDPEVSTLLMKWGLEEEMERWSFRYDRGYHTVTSQDFIGAKSWNSLFSLLG